VCFTGFWNQSLKILAQYLKDLRKGTSFAAYRNMSNKTLAVLILASQVILYGWLLKEAPKSTTDSASYYAVAQLWKRNENPYSLEKQCLVESKIIGNTCVPFGHPPILLPLLALVSNNDFEASYWRWTAILCSALLVTAFPLYWLSGDAVQTIQSLLFYPGIVSVFFGNDICFVLLAVCFCFWMIQRRKDFWAGCALSLAVVKPQFALIIGIPFLFTRPRVFWGFVVGAFSLVLFCFLLVGYSGFKGIIEITRLTAEGNLDAVRQAYMVNITGILVRNGLSPFWSWPFYLIAIIALAILYKRYGLTIETISVGIVLALFTAPHAHQYDLALLAIPLLFCHRLAPKIGSLIMIVAMSTSNGYQGALILMFTLFAIYLYRLIRSNQSVPIAEAETLN